MSSDSSSGRGSHRGDKAASLLIHLAADFIAREAGRSTLITPLRAEVSDDLKRATIFVSVFPTEEETHALSFLSRNEDEFRAYLKKEARFALLPTVRFVLDSGERNRQRLDEISKKT